MDMNSYLIHTPLIFSILLQIGKISGVVSERDYVCKIALLGKTSKETKVKGMSCLFLLSDLSDCAIYIIIHANYVHISKYYTNK